MRLHRFITESKKIRDEIVITDEKTFHQIINVFRMRIGDLLIVCDNNYNDYTCEIIERTNRELRLRIITQDQVQKDTRSIIIALALIKKDAFEYALEKMTEAGVTEIIPIVTQRTVKTGFRRDRYEDILREATEQSGRGHVPLLHDPQDLEVLLTEPFPGMRVVADFHEKNITDFFHRNDSARLVIIGPEGGWDDAERALFDKLQIPRGSLGPTVLRAETAAIIGAWCTKNL